MAEELSHDEGDGIAGPFKEDHSGGLWYSIKHGASSGLSFAHTFISMSASSFGRSRAFGALDLGCGHNCWATSRNDVRLLEDTIPCGKRTGIASRGVKLFPANSCHLRRTAILDHFIAGKLSSSTVLPVDRSDGIP